MWQSGWRILKSNEKRCYWFLLSVDNTIVLYYYILVIVTFKNKETELIWDGEFSKRLPNDIQRVARRKLIHIHSAVDINDLRVPPGNRLHALSGNMAGMYSIRINNQWRICFRWQNGNAYEVEIIDYH